MMNYRWALIDIETTGLHVLNDKITEIAVMLLTENGVEKTWHSLINPDCLIPSPITQITGISNQMVSQAPRFKDIAHELILLLEGSVFVAHNARFDYGFLKNAFKSLGLIFHAPVLCTVKLFKTLYPALNGYNLSALAKTFSLNERISHRALGDVDTLYTLLQKAFAEFSVTSILSIAKKISQKSSLPINLKTNLDTIPNSPGVYLFYGANTEIPLYVGKSIHLKQRVLSHFQADHSDAKEFAMAQQVERVEFIPTAGELSALLLESNLIKEKMPFYNRRLRRKKQVVGFQLGEVEGYSSLSLVRELVAEEEDYSDTRFGAFRSLTTAKKILLELVKIFKLCPKLCGLEHTKSACFSYQLKRCHGACIQKEAAASYNQRVNEALAQFKQESWPFAGAIAIKEENDANQLQSYLVFDQWRHLGTVKSKKSLLAFRQSIPRASEYDTYKILQNFLKTKLDTKQIIQLEKHRQSIG